MTAMYCLTTNQAPTFYYSTYNGKNMGGIAIPKVLMNKKRVKAHTPSQFTKSSSKQTKPYVSLVELGIPLDLNFFKQTTLHSSDGLFDSIAWTTLDEVRREFFNMRNKKWDDISIRQDALKYTRRMDFQKSSAYLAAKRMGILDDVCSHMEFIRNKKITLLFFL
jgi:hypothetical protein